MSWRPLTYYHQHPPELPAAAKSITSLWEDIRKGTKTVDDLLEMYLDIWCGILTQIRSDRRDRSDTLIRAVWSTRHIVDQQLHQTFLATDSRYAAYIKANTKFVPQYGGILPDWHLHPNIHQEYEYTKLQLYDLKYTIPEIAKEALRMIELLGGCYKTGG